MTHPVIPHVIDLAAPTAESLNLEVVSATFQTNQSPPVLRIDIRNPDQSTSLDDCERMSRAFEETLDTSNLIPEPYVLEISSPGVSKFLSTERDFISFKGFPVRVTTTEPYRGQQEWVGNLIRRDQESVYLNRKGRPFPVPLTLIHQVQLSDSPEE